GQPGWQPRSLPQHLPAAGACCLPREQLGHPRGRRRKGSGVRQQSAADRGRTCAVDQRRCVEHRPQRRSILHALNGRNHGEGRIVPTLLAQIAPQRSTQYAELATELAPHELRLSALDKQIESIEPFMLGRQPYLKLEISGDLNEALRRELGGLAMSSAFFWYYDQLGEVEGPLLKPIETPFEPMFPPDLMAMRRYKGKTSELFTHFLCNV